MATVLQTISKSLTVPSTNPLKRLGSNFISQRVYMKDNILSFDFPTQ